MIRFSFVVKPETLAPLRQIQARTGLSLAQQIREAIRWWVEAHEWPDANRSVSRRTRLSDEAAG